MQAKSMLAKKWKSAQIYYNCFSIMNVYVEMLDFFFEQQSFKICQ